MRKASHATRMSRVPESLAARRNLQRSHAASQGQVEDCGREMPERLGGKRSHAGVELESINSELMG